MSTAPSTTSVTTAPYGTWPSPVGADLAAAHDGRPEYLDAVGDEIWWTAPRPAEAGRRTLVRRDTAGDGGEETVLPAPWNVRSRVIEYGGRPWAGAVDAEGRTVVVFVHYPDQRLYRYDPDNPGTGPTPLTPLSDIGDGLRWADPVVLPERAEVWCVLEESTGPEPTDVRRTVAAVPLDGSAADDRTAVRELTGDGHGFTTGPRLSPDGRRMAWLVWDHPRMPWEGTELLVGDITDDGRITGVRTLAGGPEESVCQAEWAPDGALLYLSDAAGWWEPYRIAPGSDGPATALCTGREEEFGSALWKVGMRWLAPLDDGLIAVVHGRGTTGLGILDPATGDLADTPGPWTEWAPDLVARGERITGIAAGPDRGYEIVELDTRTGHTRVVGAAHRDPVDPAYYPVPEPRTFTGPDGREIHAVVHPPRNPGHRGPDGERPPYVVQAHGGPTGRYYLVLDLAVAYLTSRGIGVVQVNYGGSTGYGRAYRERLRRSWGEVDVADCAAVAHALAAEGTADGDRIAVSGGSAGGWTATASLGRPDAFPYACATISFPVLDPVSWRTGGTHDFESHYLESLIGPYATEPERYREQSPLRRADRIAAPFLLLQGLDDTICPPAQAERLLAAVEGRGVPHAYLTFPGESHGFRRADTLVRALEAELSLYARTFGFERPDVPPLELTP
ncbi:prolyl oligopeptidase family serine peptidase [Streptomyces sp. NPDC058953]|uniref:S9 family peptidase n=1 Tax=unclassified Streptomyces TaxID=2593676 RepID=UPI0036804200